MRKGEGRRRRWCADPPSCGSEGRGRPSSSGANAHSEAGRGDEGSARRHRHQAHERAGERTPEGLARRLCAARRERAREVWERDIDLDVFCSKNIVSSGSATTPPTSPKRSSISSPASRCRRSGRTGGDVLGQIAGPFEVAGDADGADQAREGPTPQADDAR